MFSNTERNLAKALCKLKVMQQTIPLYYVETRGHVARNPPSPNILSAEQQDQKPSSQAYISCCSGSHAMCSPEHPSEAVAELLPHSWHPSALGWKASQRAGHYRSLLHFVERPPGLLQLPRQKAGVRSRSCLNLRPCPALWQKRGCTGWQQESSSRYHNLSSAEAINS